MTNAKVTAVAILFALSAPVAFANTPIPAAAVFLTPIWLSVPALSAFVTGVAMLAGVVAIESAVLAWVFHRPWGESLRLAGLANLLTTLIGLVFASAQGIALLVLIGAMVYAYRQMRHAWWRRRSFVIAASLAALGLLTIWTILVVPSTLPRMVLHFYLTMFCAIILTVVFEAFFYARRVGVGRGVSWSLAANGVSYGVILLALLLTGFRSGPLIASEFLKHRIFMQAQQGEPASEVMRRLEEIYLWQDSKIRLNTPPVRDDVWFELRLVRDWADAGRQGDAQGLYKLISTYRARPKNNSGEEYMVQSWTETEAALKPAGPSQVGHAKNR